MAIPVLRKILTDRDYAINLVNHLKALSKIVVLIYGAFDLLHAGHLEIINKAREQGAVVIAGVQSDLVIQRTKDYRLPLNPLDDRMKMVATLQTVDFVIPYDDAQPLTLIGDLKPTVCVIAAADDSEPPEAKEIQKLGVRVVTIPFKEGYSTINILRSILARFSNSSNTTQESHTATEKTEKSIS